MSSPWRVDAPEPYEVMGVVDVAPARRSKFGRVRRASVHGTAYVAPPSAV